MQDVEIRDLVLKHEHSIETLATSISRMADSSTITNRKLDDVLEVIAKQNVLAEKMANIDVQTREGFDRLYTKHREYDEMHANKGCTVLQILEEKEKTNHAKMLNDIKHLTDEVQNIVETQERGVAPETLKNLLTYGALALVSIGTWIVLQIAFLDKEISSMDAKQTEIIKNLSDKVQEMSKITEASNIRINIVESKLKISKQND